MKDIQDTRAPAQARPYTVAVVDDSSTMRTIITRELEADGFLVVPFSDGLEALSSLHWMATPPDLITLDIDMPRMDGFTCCAKIRELEATGVFGQKESRIPVLFVSSNDTVENRSRGFHLGVLEFISKPFNRGDIAKAVSRVLRPQALFAGMTVLVVDDDASVRRMVARSLQQMGLTILQAENGRQAFDLVREHTDRIDLVIVDFHMPIMQGDEFIHLVRQLPDSGLLPVLSMSGTGDSDTVLRMFHAGSTDYLMKPFLAEELQARVQVHLQLRQQFRHLEEMNRNLYDRAVNDALTGLRNKRFFQEVFEETFARAVRDGSDLSCLFFDLDHFKAVNDSCGHPFGDYVLRTIGALVKKNIRRGDMAARFGGEEFVIVLSNTGSSAALETAEKFRSLIENQTFQDQGHEWPVRVSIGLATLQAHKPVSAMALLQMADQALYQAKNAGRNQVALYSK